MEPASELATTSQGRATLLRSPEFPFTPGFLTAWLLFSFVTLTIGMLALPGVGRFYDLREFYAAGSILLHQPTQLFNLSVQQAVQNAMVFPMSGCVPFYHPAYEALLFVPLTLLSYRQAYIAFAIFNLLLLALCYRLAPLASDPRVAKIPRSLLFFVCFPALMGIVQGQDSVLFFFVIILAWRALASGRDRTAGILLAAALFKLQIVLPLVFFLAIYLPTLRRNRLLLSFLPSAAAVALLCLLITGPQGMAAWLHLITLSSIASHLGAHPQTAIHVYAKAMPTINGLLYVCGARLLAPRVSFALSVILSLLVLAVALYLCRTARSTAIAFCTALAAALLLAPHLFVYDYVLLLLPILLLKQPQQLLFTALYYLLNYVLFAIGGIHWFAFMALVPLALLGQLLWTQLRPAPAVLHQPASPPNAEPLRVS